MITWRSEEYRGRNGELLTESRNARAGFLDLKLRRYADAGPWYWSISPGAGMVQICSGTGLTEQDAMNAVLESVVTLVVRIQGDL